MVRQSETHLDELASVQAAHHKVIGELQSDKEQVRMCKDREMRQLHGLIEDSRSTYQRQITALEQRVNEFAASLQTSYTTIGALRSELEVRKDVGEQISMERDAKEKI